MARKAGAGARTDKNSPVSRSGLPSLELVLRRPVGQAAFSGAGFLDPVTASSITLLFSLNDQEPPGRTIPVNG